MDVSRYELCFALTEADGALVGRIEYQTRRFGRATVKRLCDDWLDALGEWVSEPDRGGRPPRRSVVMTDIPAQLTNGCEVALRSAAGGFAVSTSPGRYQPIISAFIVGWHPEHLRVQLAFGARVGASAQAAPPDTPERRYALREVKTRLHQASFRDAVLAAYGPMGDGVRFLTYPSLGCSMPLTSSWMRTSSLGTRSSRMVCR